MSDEFKPYWEWDTKLPKAECTHGEKSWSPMVYVHSRREIVRVCHQCKAYTIISAESDEAKAFYPAHSCGGLAVTQLDPNTFNKVSMCTKCDFFEVRSLEDDQLLSQSP